MGLACRKCLSECRPDARFCGHCGSAVGGHYLFRELWRLYKWTIVLALGLQLATAAVFFMASDEKNVGLGGFGEWTGLGFLLFLATPAVNSLQAVWVLARWVLSKHRLHYVEFWVHFFAFALCAWTPLLFWYIQTHK